MCLAIPGKIIEINDDKVIVDYGKEKREAKALFKVKKGDYVIVTQKFVINIIPENEALKSIELFRNG
ncbi:MAG TPA: HypC/HybG/HupF family hydrogenase formation chaperone [Candidatus Pacearchaeota archaeon]|nr:HupF/HypC family protein [archaeon BMS3Abin17]HDK42139.1 HypC/HybG/HupF family hydrogenase formation chaperone [Candidatus Pacearchaeota archaeon]HDZ61316.1 HypC/HybG/HupF family hydrogenase formation chaperone [Candidatus Pacearchaeota archaeon]